MSLRRRFIRDAGDVVVPGDVAATTAAAAVSGATGDAPTGSELGFGDAVAPSVGSEAFAAAACADIQGARLLKDLLVAVGSGHLGQRLLRQGSGRGDNARALASGARAAIAVRWLGEAAAVCVS